MSRAHYIAGDWGTSRLRLSLCLDDRVVETRQGPGIGALREPAGAALRTLVTGWRDTHGSLPIVLCGMAGSRNGWREAPYLTCPADVRALGGAAGAAAPADEGFERGLEAAAALGGASLLHALFAVRSRQLLEGRSHDWALSYLSGLMIGTDVRGALPLFGGSGEVVLIGDGALNERYTQALCREGIAASCLDGEHCALAGLRTLWQP